MPDTSLSLERKADDWILAGPDAEPFELINEYLAYLADRNYSPQSVRAYGFALLAFCRWLFLSSTLLPGSGSRSYG